MGKPIDLSAFVDDPCPVPSHKALIRKLERLKEYIEMHVAAECVTECHRCSKEFLKEIEREAGGEGLWLA